MQWSQFCCLFDDAYPANQTLQCIPHSKSPQHYFSYVLTNMIFRKYKPASFRRTRTTQSMLPINCLSFFLFIIFLYYFSFIYSLFTRSIIQFDCGDARTREETERMAQGGTRTCEARRDQEGIGAHLRRVLT